jgi:hypothetical protein
MLEQQDPPPLALRLADSKTENDDDDTDTGWVCEKGEEHSTGEKD